LRITRQDGAIYGFTDFDADMIFPIVPNGAVFQDLPWGSNENIMTTVGHTYVQYISSNAITKAVSSSKVQISVATALSGPITELVLIRTLANSLDVVDVTPITFDGNPTPTFGAGLYTSDVIGVQIDAAHDYYFSFSGNASGVGDLTYSAPPQLTISGVATFNSLSPLSVAWDYIINGGTFPSVAGNYFIAAWTLA
jgi:hypothetical protein